MALTVFELLTAMFAVDSFRLKDDWAARKRRLKDSKLPCLDGMETNEFLQAISLLTTREKRIETIAAGGSEEAAPGISCKKKDVLRLALTDYLRYADQVEEGFRRAARLLHGQKFFSARDLPYRTQLTPMAAVLAVVREHNAENVRSKLVRWFWCGVFGELYGGAIESRFARDLPEVLRWIDGGPEPGTVIEANFQSQRLLSMRTRNSAAYKGLHALLLRDGCQDFRSGDPIDERMYFDEKIDIHHIFPSS